MPRGLVQRLRGRYKLRRLSEYVDVARSIRQRDGLHVSFGYYREYYRRNKQQQYCRYVITPKLKKLGLET